MSNTINQILGSMALEIQQFGATPELFGSPPTIQEYSDALYQLILTEVIGEDFVFDRPQDDYLPNVFEFLMGKNELRAEQRYALAKLFNKEIN